MTFGLDRFAHAAIFLESIGLEIDFTSDVMPSFLPGVWWSPSSFVEGQHVLHVNPDMAWVHDVFHEAGHYAVLPPHRRALVGHNQVFEFEEGEVEAIAWSFAALEAADLDTHMCFTENPHASNGGGAEVFAAMRAGVYVGIRKLTEMHMTTHDTFPTLFYWMQE